MKRTGVVRIGRGGAPTVDISEQTRCPQKTRNWYYTITALHRKILHNKYEELITLPPKSTLTRTSSHPSPPKIRPNTRELRKSERTNARTPTKIKIKRKHDHLKRKRRTQIFLLHNQSQEPYPEALTDANTAKLGVCSARSNIAWVHTSK